MKAEDDRVLTDKPKPTFKTPIFEGPLDLLLFYITKSKINIYDIPIAEITDQFISYIDEHKVDLADCSEFYKMAADLLYIKSRMLLPVDVEFSDEYEDPRQELVERLIEYQKIKKYTQLLLGSSDSSNFYVERKENYFALPYTDQQLFEGVDTAKLLETFYKLLTRKIPSKKIFNIYEDVTDEQKIALISELLETRDKITIEDVIVHMDEPLHIICAFMAILAACKKNMILISQDVPDGEIYIVKRPQDFDESLADVYDDEYDEIVENNLAEADDFSILRPDEKEREEEEGFDEEPEEEEGGKPIPEDDDVDEEDLLLDDED
jgi:Uncharacterized conserved protein